MTIRTYPFSSLRLWASSVENSVFADKILHLLKTEPDAFDDVWLGTLLCLPSLEKHRRMAELDALFAVKIRQLGIGVSLQIPESLGHRGCGIGSYEACNWELMVGANGVTCANVSCPRSPEFIAYERRMIALYAAAIKPDTIWIDDDLRMNNHGPVSHGCFCSRCLTEFSRRNGRSWSREALAAELFLKTEATAVRLEWVRFNQSTLAEAAGQIAAAAAAACPGVRMGLQNEYLSSMYNGMTHHDIFKAMSDATGHPAGVRPGGGAYTDYDPRELITKAFAVGGAARSAGNSGHVDAICAEIDNYPRTALGKTSYGTVLEGALGLAWGCNSLSYVLNVHQDSSVEFDRSYYRRIAAWQPFFSQLASREKHFKSGGLNLVRSLRHPANTAACEWNGLFLDEARELLFNGIPIYWDDADQGLAPSILTAAAAEGFDQDDFNRMILNGNILMSGEAFMVLQKKKLTESLDITGRMLATDAQCGEQFTGDPFNGTDAGAFYYLPQTHAPACVFELRNPEARALGQAVRHLQTENFGCSSFILEHHGSYRLAVCGLPARFSREISEAKHRQLLQLADWVSGGKLPVIAQSRHAQVLIPLLFDDGKLYGSVVLNNSIEPATLTLELRNLPKDRTEMSWTMPEKPRQKLPLQKNGQKGTCQVVIPDLPGWGIGLLS